MKKALALLLALVMCLSLCACGGESKTAENPYEKYAKYEELFVYLEENDWDNANAYIQNYFGITENVSMNEVEIPVESEPTYESIEITMDNWQEYFEFTSEEFWEDDAFGDAVRYRRYIYFALKDEYQDKVASMDVALSCSYTVDYRYYEIDLQNRVFTLGEVYKSDVKESRPESIYYTPYAVWNEYCSENPGMFTLDTNIPILEWVDTMDVARIQGTIEIQTN